MNDDIEMLFRALRSGIPIPTPPPEQIAKQALDTFSREYRKAIRKRRQINDH